jgi:hypothetical protein
LPVQESPFWLIYSCMIGRLALFGLLWSSAYLLATALQGLMPPLIMAGLLVVSPALITLMPQASHPLFSAMSAFALWQTLLFAQTSAVRPLILASLFVALSILARSGEGLVIWAALVVIAAWNGYRARRLLVSVAASLLPCAALLSAYLVFDYAQLGRFDLGMAEYSYFTFEQGHGLAYQSDYDPKENSYVNGQMDARRLFGTPEENNYSILTAITRNPEAYLQRVPRLVRLAPEYALAQYGGTLGMMFFLFAARGVIELVRRKLYGLLSILLLWCSYTIVYLVLVFQPVHFLFPYYVVFVLTGIGLVCTINNFENGKERVGWGVALAALLIGGLQGERAIIFSSAIFLILTFVLVAAVLHRYQKIEVRSAVGILLIFLALGLKAHYPAPKFLTLGEAEAERAALFMKQHLVSGTPVAAYEPINVWMADMTYIPMMRSTLPDIQSRDDLRAWMNDNRLGAIYVDAALRNNEPKVWEVVQQQIGDILKPAFVSKAGDVQVLTRDQGEAYAGLPADYIERPWFSSKPRFHERTSRSQ